MRDFTGSERAWDEALSGRAPAGDPLASFVGEVRTALEGGPEETVARAHIAAMVRAAAEPVTLVVLTPRILSVRKRALRLASFAAAALFAVSGISTGLAFAGVIRMPEPARRVLRDIGINVPGPAQHKPHPEPAQSVPAAGSSHGPQGSGGKQGGKSGSGSGSRHGSGNGGTGAGDGTGSGDKSGSGDRPGSGDHSGSGGDPSGSGDHLGSGDHSGSGDHGTPRPSVTPGDSGDGGGSGSGHDGSSDGGTPTPEPSQSGD
jgi:hypothetical protein